MSEIFELMNEKLMIVVGEIGLDYFRNISSKETQIKCFREQLKIAQEIKKPVIIHNRNSDKDEEGKILKNLQKLEVLLIVFQVILIWQKVFRSWVLYFFFGKLNI